MNNSSDNIQAKRAQLEKKQVFMEFERAYNAWITASIGALIGGMYVAKFLGMEKNSLIVSYFGIAIVLAGILFSIQGFLDYRSKLSVYESQTSKNGVSTNLVLFISSFFIIIGIISLIVIIQFNKT